MGPGLYGAHGALRVCRETPVVSLLGEPEPVEEQSARCGRVVAKKPDAAKESK